MKVKKSCILWSLILVFSFVCLTGCAKRTEEPAQAENSVQAAQADDQMSKSIVDSLDSSVLQYQECRTTNDKVTEYAFLIVSENADGAGEEIKNLYNSANQALQTEEYKNKKFCFYIEVPHYDQDAYCIVAYFENFDDQGIADHISNVTVNGLGDMAEMYQEGYSYEVNDSNYWNYFSDNCNVNFTQEFESL